mmetsp:Transcript_28350/g.27287  ORF Transcript_28350/g.27287 Transcript_28350/m.27287 type:complete len:164 (-) Transcript_28350:264-755(-)
MLGDQMLVAPKILENNGEDLTGAFWGTVNSWMNVEMEDQNKITVYLPQGHSWYYFYTKQVFYTKPQHSSSGKKMDMVIPANEQGVFIKGGSIFPIKLHRGKLSMLRAFQQPIRLEIYLEPSLSKLLAQGLLYMDDGESLNHLTGERTLVEYTLELQQDRSWVL